MRYVVNVSGGLASYEALRRTLERHGAAQTVAVFADTRTEDADLYRFLDDTERVLGVQIVRLSDGRDIWQVMRDKRAITVRGAAPCSKTLKREVVNRWLEQEVSDQPYTLVFGYDWTEPHRAKRLARQMAPQPIWCPLLEPPYLTKAEIARQVEAAGIAPPRLYALGFPHNNCGGGCVRAGQGHFAHLLRVLPEVYAEWEQNEAALGEHLGKRVTILKDRRGKSTRKLSLTQLRERVQAGQSYEDDLWGGCGCFTE